MFSQRRESVYLIPNSVSSSSKSKLIKLRNPHSKQTSLYLIDEEKRKLYEVQGYDEKYRTWFCKGNTYPDGCIRIVTPFNPVYLILPYLRKTTKNVPLVDLLEDKQFPAMSVLPDLAEDLTCVADRIGPPDLNVWSYNESSTLNWLSEKVDKLSSLLQQQREKPSQTCSIALDKESYKVLAFGIISENLSEDLSLKLREHLKLPHPQKSEPNSNAKGDNKRPKLEEKPLETSNQNKKPAVKPRAKDKALAKSAKGSKSITSFFTKKC